MLQSERIESFRVYLSSVRSVKTVEIYCSAARQFELFVDKSGFALPTIPPSILSDFSSFLSRTLRPRSVHVFIYGTKQYLRWLKQHGMPIPELYPPMLPSIKTSIPLVLEEGSIAAYLEICKSISEPYCSAMRLLGLSTLRVSEMCKLKLKNIDNTKYGVVLEVLHSKSGSRRVPTPMNFKGVLQEYITNYRGKIHGTEWLFPSSRFPQKHIEARQIREYFRIIRKRLGLVGFTPHTLRRTWLTIMNREGVNPVMLQKIAGHKNLATTSIYIIPSEAEMFSAVNKTQIKEKIN